MRETTGIACRRGPARPGRGVSRPPADEVLEKREPRGPVPEHDVVEARKREPRAEPTLRAVAGVGDRALADLVRERLARPDDVAVHLVRDVALGAAADAAHRLDGLVAVPAERVHARVD